MALNDGGKSLKRMFLAEFRRGFRSGGLYLGAVLLATMTLIGTTDIIGTLREYRILQEEVRCISFLYQVTYSDIFCYLIPIVCTLAMSASYQEDLQSGIYKYILVRTSVKSYKWSKVLNCAIYGILTAFLALILICIGSVVIFPVNHEEMEILHKLTAKYYFSIILRVVLIFLNSSFYAVFGALAAAITKNRYMAYAAPFIFNYVISMLASAYLYGYPVLNPKEWLANTMIRSATCLKIMVLVNIIVIIVFAHQIGRDEYYE